MENQHSDDAQLRAIEDRVLARHQLALDPQAVELIAVVCHEANRAYCVLIGDPSQVEWTLAPLWQRDSMRLGVRAVLDGSARTPEQQHEAWCAVKRADGWTYGVRKDADAKTHHCLVPYADLPPEQRAKDFLSRGIILGLADAYTTGLPF